MDQRARISNLPPTELSTDNFGSLSLGRAYIDTIQQSVSSLDGGDLIDALERLDLAYDEFPELELDRPRREVLAGLQSTAETLPDRAGIPLLMYCVAAGPSCSSALTSMVEKFIKSDFYPLLPVILRSLSHRGTFSWYAIEPLLKVLRQLGETETVLQLISKVLSCLEFIEEKNASDCGDVLKLLLSDQHAPGINSAMLARAVQSARHRLSRPALGRRGPASREAVLATAERLKPILSAARPGPHPDLGWPSGRMSFDEFLLQWPCEVELPVELDDAEFIEEAYRAILLRGPDIAESDQYLGLLRTGRVSKSWIIEDLLASTELRSLERRVRVICGGRVITEPGSSGEEEVPAATWPWRSAV